MKKFRFLSILFCALITCTAVAKTAEVPPVAVLKTASAKLFSTLEKDHTRIRTNPAYLERLVRKQILPLIATDEMAGAMVGRYRRQATPAQWTQFKKKLASIVIRTYAAPLADYSGETLTFLPVRGYTPNATRAEVHSIVIRRTGQRIPVTYKLIRLNGKWKVKDFSVEGISMVQNYRAQFAGVLAQYGFGGLLKRLNARRA